MLHLLFVSLAVNLKSQMQASDWCSLGHIPTYLAAREAGNASSWLLPWEELTNGNGSLKVESSQKRKQRSILPAINNFNN